MYDNQMLSSAVISDSGIITPETASSGKLRKLIPQNKKPNIERWDALLQQCIVAKEYADSETDPNLAQNYYNEALDLYHELELDIYETFDRTAKQGMLNQSDATGEMLSAALLERVQGIKDRYNVNLRFTAGDKTLRVNFRNPKNEHFRNDIRETEKIVQDDTIAQLGLDSGVDALKEVELEQVRAQIRERELEAIKNVDSIMHIEL